LRLALALLLVALAWAPAPARAQAPATADWPHVGGDLGSARYSPLADIDRGNVGQLRVAWTYRHGDFYLPRSEQERDLGTAFEATPLLVDGRLIFSTPFNRVIALDPESGRELWTFDPKLDRSRPYVNGWVNRGVAYWSGDAADGGACARRVLHATLDSRLIALDAATGRPCAQFGQGGSVDLHAGVERLHDPSDHKMTSPALVVGDVVVVGSSLADGQLDQPPGDVRGYDVRSGRLLWRFGLIPAQGEPGVETWLSGSAREGMGANAWGPLSGDAERDLVFVPTSSASPDFFGGRRPGANLYANSLVVLRARTGERVWHFQTVHHDLWDYDVPAAPNLVRLRRDGREIEAVAQVTKQGFVFVFERDGGTPLFPIEERPVPPSDVAGEWTSPTQPFPLRPPPLVPQQLGEADLWDVDPQHQAACRARLRELRWEGMFTPPSERGTIIYPSHAGGANWSGAAYDPVRRRLFVPANNLPLVRYVLPASEPAGPAARPSLLQRLLGRASGSDALPAMRRTRGDLFRIGDRSCLRPPWGLLVAVDLDAGEIAWRAPIGETPEGIRGLSNMGPALVTGGGLVFHGGAPDPHLRAHDADTGEVVAQFELPASLHAGPITYKLRPDGRQFLVIAPGGHFNLARAQVTTELGDWVIAYTLP
jgi:quinoprotein glucose dehydrogenase